MTTKYKRKSSVFNSNSLLYAELTSSFLFSGIPQNIRQIIPFDSAVNTPSDPVRAEANGNIIFEQSGTYFLLYHFNFHAPSSNTVQFIDQALINSDLKTQYGTRFTIPGSVTCERSIIYNFSNGDIFNCGVWTTTQGTDDAALVSFIAPGSLLPVIAFDLTVTKLWD
jgi:hypothetical protein